MNIGALLRQGRQRAELSQRVAAHRAGVSQGSLSRWETGVILPGFHEVDRVLAVFGLQLDAVLVAQYADMHATFAKTAALSVDRRVMAYDLMACMIFSQLSRVPGDVTVCGGLAAVLHGIPVERIRGELLLPDNDEALARVVLTMRYCYPEIILDGQRYGVEFTVGLLRRHPVCDFFCRGAWITTRLMLPGQHSPATTVVPYGEGTLIVQSIESLTPDADLRADVLKRWRAWRA